MPNFETCVSVWGMDINHGSYTSPTVNRQRGPQTRHVNLQKDVAGLTNGVN